jgi:Tfp pilus assembly protein PilF
LGYVQDNMGVYFVSRRAWKFAEAQFRRAVYLNPFEPLFLAHLATCLYQMGRLKEAQKLASTVVKAGRTDAVEELLKLLEKPFRRKYLEETGGK